MDFDKALKLTTISFVDPYHSSKLSKEISQLFPENEPQEIESLFHHLKEVNMTIDKINSSIDLLDLKNWLIEVDAPSILTPSEVLRIYDLFVNKKENAWHKSYSSQYGDDFPYEPLSQGWTVVLNSLSPQSIKKAIIEAPRLQAMLSKKLAKITLESLSLSYGFPTIEIYKLYIQHRLKILASLEEYKELIDEFYPYYFSSKNYSEGVGVQNISKRQLKIFREALSVKFETLIVPVCKYLWKIITGRNPHRIEELALSSRKYLINFGRFMEIISNKSFSFKNYESEFYTIHDFEIIYDSEYSYEFYDRLEEKDKKAIQLYYSTTLRSAFVEFARTPYYSGKALTLEVLLNRYKNLVSSDTFSELVAISKSSWTAIQSLDELKIVHDLNFIDGDIFELLFKTLISSHDIKSLASLMTELTHENGWFDVEKLSPSLQKYILARIVEMYDEKENLNKGMSVHIGWRNGWCNLKGFIRWLTNLRSGQWRRIDVDAVQQAINKAISKLNTNDLEHLYANNILI